ncbi:probable multidrug resistance-associated protein lethal(2)03659 isoform X1 [Diabrotica virgifera virgifera]|uniref:Multidrug resistance-associated protein lethal(2)03659 n=3 Tax=Diabrotica virgifera virgifera TaxID=50390 RepID=A0ABM5JVU1_DIAVI|nr:probable multidrug resistance-associated protein lethal(2)03659 isoform X1 [Diabrotica virgifera virgifera]
MEEPKHDEKQKKNPFDSSNILSELFFCWLLPYFVTGYKRELTEDDMYSHRKVHDSTRLGDQLEKLWTKETLHAKSPSLLRCIIRTYSIQITGLSLCILTAECLKTLQPLFIAKLMRLYQSVDFEENKTEIYLYALLVVGIAFINIIISHFYNFRIAELGMEVRISCSSLMYRKALKLSKLVLVDTTIGKMVNLMSNDVGRFDTCFQFIHLVWLGPIMVTLVTYLTYSTYGWMGVSGVLLLIASMPMQMFLGKKNSEFRLATALKTDERVRLMNEIINGIQVIKMYTWEKPFTKIVEVARLNEIKFIRMSSYIKGFLMSMSLSNSRCSIALAVITYVATGNTLTSTYAYTIASYYRILGIVTMFFPQSVSQVSELLASIRRIQAFLVLDEKKMGRVNKAFLNLSDLDPKGLKKETMINTGFKLHQVSAKWDRSHSEMNLEKISMDVSSKSLVAVVGAVGSGKSSLFQVILQELEPSEGYIEVNGKISFASQEPWLFGGTIRQNILFGQPYDKQRYEEVLMVCALQRDLTLLPYGDKTRIGERGITLSGGQRSRINLARAIYKEADIYLLDDPLSAVDTHVGKHLFEECICRFLADKCVVLVTHQLQYLKTVANIILLENGMVRASGSYEDIIKSNSIFTKLLENLEKEEEDEKNQKHVKNKLYIENQGEKEAPALIKEEKGVGKVTTYVYMNYIRAGGNLCKVVILLLAFILSQVLDTSSEYFVTIWVNIEQWVIQTYNSTTVLDKSNQSSTVIANPYDLTQDHWLTSFFTGNITVYVYATFVLLLLIVTYTRSIFFYRWGLSSSIVMHNKMFDNIIYSPMHFFNNNPSGRILNRFSKDIGIVDEVLPTTILDTLQIGLSVLSICLIIGTLSPWMLIPTIIVLVIFYFMRFIFLETSRDVKRVESINRSPVYSHLTASLQGLTTIRAFKAQDILAVEFDNLQNIHSAAFFMYLGATRTFAFWLDFFCVVYIGLVLVALLVVKEEKFGGNVGLALTQSMSLTGMFQYGIRQWSELENQMTSVERVQEYADLTKEIDEGVDPPKTWPEQGQIVFNKLSLGYSKTLPLVLKNLSFIVNPKEKIGIVGRTGAGKSSIIQAMFRLTFTEGSIIIDGIDSKLIPLRKMRSKISIIPQEPVLFSGTVRYNLDPFNEYPDEILWKALEDTELKYVVSDLPEGLDNKMAEGGINFSVGQRQLFCLARAIVRQNKILILDEATANVDLHTDGLIQKTIRKKFADCTVITVAHRLHTIMDSDKVLVMDAGEILEYDSPYILLQNTNGVFYSLLMQTGTNTAQNLIEIANKAYMLSQAANASS